MNIDLGDPCFADVNMADVKKIYIGIGDRNATSGDTMGDDYIDDIWLYVPRCLTTHAPEGDFDEDCDVDHDDLDMMVGEWLDYTYTVDANAPNASKLVAHWKFDETDGFTANEEIGGKDGFVDGATWDPCTPDGSVRSLNFANTVEDNVYHEFSLPKSAGTITHWLRLTGSISKGKGAAYYEGDGATADHDGWGGNDILEIHTGVYGYQWYFCYQDGEMTSVSGGSIDYEDEIWVHVAATWDRSGDLVIYANGIKLDTEDISGVSFDTKTATHRVMGYSAGVSSIGGTHNKSAWNGGMDDVRVYSYALSQAEVVSVMGESSVHQPVHIPEVDLYTDDKIDFKDFAILAGEWLNEVLWP